MWFSNRRARLRKHAGNINASPTLGFAALPLANMTCQYTMENAQHDWRNGQFTNYNMFQQNPYHHHHHHHSQNQDITRNEYSTLFDANYALAQAQMAHVQRTTNVQINNTTNLIHNHGIKMKDANKDINVQDNETCWNKNSEWIPATMSSGSSSTSTHPSQINLHTDTANFNSDMFNQTQQYIAAANKNYWG